MTAQLVTAAGWYPGGGRVPAMRLLHATGAAPVPGAVVVALCAAEPPIALFPGRVSDHGARCRACCELTGTPHGFGPAVPEAPTPGTLRLGPVEEFTAAWTLDALDLPYTAAQLGAVTRDALQAAVEAAGFRLAGRPVWEIVHDSPFGDLVAAVSVRRVLGGGV